MLVPVTAPVDHPDPMIPEVPLRIDRRTLAKRRWRKAADDGMEFGVEVERPLQPGQVVHQHGGARYVLHQDEEPLIEIPLDMTACAAAGVGWSIGNLHIELAGEPHRLLTPDEPLVRQLLIRLKIPHRCISGVFRPGRFVRGDASTHELGPSHQH